MKIVITGASGLLGRAVVRVFASLMDSAEDRILGLVFSRMPTPPSPAVSFRKCDLCDVDATRALLLEEKPDVIVHCAAERRPDVCQNDVDATRKLNVASVETLGTVAGELKAFLVYISTDYIFDGTQPPYQVGAQPHPLNLYGQTKLDGETALWKVRPDAGVLRVPILYGVVEYLAESAVSVLADGLLKSRKAQKSGDPVPEMAVDNWQQRFPTHCDDVARVLFLIIQKRKSTGPSVCGTWHFSGEEQFTKYSITKIMAEVLRLDFADKIQAVNKPPPGATPRPQNAKLFVTLPEGVGSFDPIPFRQGIEAALEPFREQFK